MYIECQEIDARGSYFTGNPKEIVAGQEKEGDFSTYSKYQETSLNYKFIDLFLSHSIFILITK